MIDLHLSVEGVLAWLAVVGLSGFLGYYVLIVGLMFEPPGSGKLWGCSVAAAMILLPVLFGWGMSGWAGIR